MACNIAVHTRPHGAAFVAIARHEAPIPARHLYSSKHGQAVHCTGPLLVCITSGTYVISYGLPYLECARSVVRC